MSYFPKKNKQWETLSPTAGGFDEIRLKNALELADKFESPWPYDLDIAGSVPGLTDIEKPPYNEVLGVFKPRGRNNGCILKGGKIAAQWGDVDRVDMTFSIAKSYLAILTGIAIGDGLISNVDALVRDSVRSGEFDSQQNKTISWRHLLEQTSEWEGTLWGKPDSIDRNRQVELRKIILKRETTVIFRARALFMNIMMLGLIYYPYVYYMFFDNHYLIFLGNGLWILLVHPMIGFGMAIRIPL